MASNPRSGGSTGWSRLNRELRSIPARVPGPRSFPIVATALSCALLWNAVRFDVFRAGLPSAVGISNGLSGRALISGRFTTLFTGAMLTRDSFMAISMVFSLMVFLGLYEWFAGWWRALTVAISATVLGPVVVTAAAWLGAQMQWDFADRTLSTIDYGASAITAGGGGALVGILRNRWISYGGIAFIVGGLLLHHQLADWIHLVAFITGILLARTLEPSVGSERLGPSRLTEPRRSLQTLGIGVFSCLALIAGSYAAIQAPSVAAVEPHPAAANPTGESASATTPATNAEGPTSPVRVDVKSYHSDALGMDRKVVVVVPRNYDGGSRRYPVIEMLHGFPGQDAEGLVPGLDIIPSVETYDYIAVLPDGVGPKVPESDYADTPTQKMGTATGPELRSWVDAHYRTSGWSVAGLSSGGYGAVSLGAFGNGAYESVCAMGGHFTPVPPAFKDVSEAIRSAASPTNHVSATGPRTLLIAGDSDKQSITLAKTYIAAMDRVGQKHEPLMLVPGGHNDATWKAGYGRCVEFALKR